MDSEFWKVVFTGKNVNVLVNVNGYYIVDKDLFVISVNNSRLGPYATLMEAKDVIASLGLEG